MLANGQEARYLLALGTILSVEDGQEVEAGDVLARVPREAAKTRDITGGLPRVAELFEARKPKDNAIIGEIAGRIEFGKDYKAKRKIAIVPEGEGAEPVEYLIPKCKVIDVQEGDFVKRGDKLIDGNPVRTTSSSARRRGAGRISRHRDPGGLSTAGREDQRQAHRGDRSPDAAEGRDHRRRRHHLAGRRAGRPAGDRDRERQARRGEAKPAKAEPVLLGITKASPADPVFISAASFQETTRVLTEAAVAGKIDTLQGLKENVIVGRLIPAGTGGVMNRLKAIAAQRDRAILAAGNDGEERSRVPTLEEERAAD